MNAKEAAELYGLKPNKALGQNFLIDESAVERIISCAAEPRLPILEIGPGLGALTEALALSELPAAAVELDGVLCGILEKRFPSVKIINEDFLKTSLRDIHTMLGGADLTVLGNLPYYITSQIVSKLVLSKLPIKRMVLMMQDEAAERFLASPGDKNYVPLTVLCRYLFDVRPLLSLSPASYWPQPEVSSTVLVFDSKGTEIEDDFVKIVKCSFLMRRKTLLNNLLSLGLGRDKAAEIIEQAGLSPSVRAEKLSVVEFLSLASVYKENTDKH